MQGDRSLACGLRDLMREQRSYMLETSTLMKRCHQTPSRWQTGRSRNSSRCWRSATATISIVSIPTPFRKRRLIWDNMGFSFHWFLSELKTLLDEATILQLEQALFFTSSLLDGSDNPLYRTCCRATAKWSDAAAASATVSLTLNAAATARSAYKSALRRDFLLSLVCTFSALWQFLRLRSA